MKKKMLLVCVMSVIMMGCSSSGGGSGDDPIVSPKPLPRENMEISEPVKNIDNSSTYSVEAKNVNGDTITFKATTIEGDGFEKVELTGENDVLSGDSSINLVKYDDGSTSISFDNNGQSLLVTGNEDGKIVVEFNNGVETKELVFDTVEEAYDYIQDWKNGEFVVFPPFDLPIIEYDYWKELEDGTAIGINKTETGYEMTIYDTEGNIVQKVEVIKEVETVRDEDRERTKTYTERTITLEDGTTKEILVIDYDYDNGGTGKQISTDIFYIGKKEGAYGTDHQYIGFEDKLGRYIELDHYDNGELALFGNNGEYDLNVFRYNDEGGLDSTYELVLTKEETGAKIVIIKDTDGDNDEQRDYKIELSKDGKSITFGIEDGSEGSVNTIKMNGNGEAISITTFKNLDGDTTSRDFHNGEHRISSDRMNKTLTINGNTYTYDEVKDHFTLIDPIPVKTVDLRNGKLEYTENGDGTANCIITTNEGHKYYATMNLIEDGYGGKTLFIGNDKAVLELFGGHSGEVNSDKYAYLDITGEDGRELTLISYDNGQRVLGVSKGEKYATIIVNGEEKQIQLGNGEHTILWDTETGLMVDGHKVTKEKLEKWIPVVDPIPVYTVELRNGKMEYTKNGDGTANCIITKDDGTKWYATMELAENEYGKTLVFENQGKNVTFELDIDTDGSKNAYFNIDDNANRELTLIAYDDGQRVLQLSKDSKRFEATISDDGKHITYINGSNAIYIDTTGEIDFMQLTNGENHISFEQYGEGYVMYVNGVPTYFDTKEEMVAYAKEKYQKRQNPPMEDMPIIEYMYSRHYEKYSIYYNYNNTYRTGYGIIETEDGKKIPVKITYEIHTPIGGGSENYYKLVIGTDEKVTFRVVNPQNGANYLDIEKVFDNVVVTFMVNKKDDYGNQRKSIKLVGNNGTSLNIGHSVGGVDRVVVDLKNNKGQSVYFYRDIDSEGNITFTSIALESGDKKLEVSGYGFNITDGTRYVDIDKTLQFNDDGTISYVGRTLSVGNGSEEHTIESSRIDKTLTIDDSTYTYDQVKDYYTYIGEPVEVYDYVYNLRNGGQLKFDVFSDKLTQGVYMKGDMELMVIGSVDKDKDNTYNLVVYNEDNTGAGNLSLTRASDGTVEHLNFSNYNANSSVSYEVAKDGSKYAQISTNKSNQISRLSFVDGGMSKSVRIEHGEYDATIIKSTNSSDDTSYTMETSDYIVYGDDTDAPVTYKDKTTNEIKELDMNKSELVSLIKSKVNTYRDGMSSTQIETMKTQAINSGFDFEVIKADYKSMQRQAEKENQQQVANMGVSFLANSTGVLPLYNDGDYGVAVAKSFEVNDGLLIGGQLGGVEQELVYGVSLGYSF